MRDEMRQLVRAAATPAAPGERTKETIARASRRLGFTFGRTKRYWYREIAYPFALDVERARSIGRKPSDDSTAHRRGGARPAQHGAFIHDDQGVAWRLGSPELKEIIGRSDGELSVDLGEYAVRCLGWIEAWHQPKRMYLRLAPDIAHPRALLSVFEVLCLSQEVAVSVTSWCGDRWIKTKFSDAGSAARSFAGALERAQKRRATHFTAHRQSVGTLIRDHDLKLLEVLREIGSAGAEVSLASAISLAKFSSAAVCIAHRGSTEPHWSFEYQPPSHRVFSPEEYKSLTRFQAVSSPDPEYFGWCASFYDKAAGLAEPIVDDVRATVKRRYLPPISFAYRRLLIPTKASEGGAIMIVASRRAANA